MRFRLPFLSLLAVGVALQWGCDTTDSDTSPSSSPEPILETDKSAMAVELAKLARHTDLIRTSGFFHEDPAEVPADDSLPCVNPALTRTVEEDGTVVTDTSTYVDARGNALPACPDEGVSSRRMLVAMRVVGADTAEAHYDISIRMSVGQNRLVQRTTATGSASFRMRDGFAGEFASLRSSGTATVTFGGGTGSESGVDTTHYQFRFGGGQYSAEISVIETLFGPWSMNDAVILHQGRNAGSLRYSAEDDRIRVYDVDGREVQEVLGRFGTSGLREAWLSRTSRVAFPDFRAMRF